jgi:hypothetical protein
MREPLLGSNHPETAEDEGRRRRGRCGTANEPLQDAPPEDPSMSFIIEARTINEPLVAYGSLFGFMRVPRPAGKPRFGPSLSLPSEAVER